MLITKHEKVAKNLRCSMPLTILGGAAMVHARESFADYQNRGIILNGSFEDIVWKTSDEALKVSLPFLVDRDDGKQKFLDWIGVDPAQYTMYVKTYISFRFGDITLRTIRGLTKTLMQLPFMTANEAEALTKNTDSIAEFLSLLPGGTAWRDVVIEKLEEYTAMWRNRPFGAESRRVLSEFNSYLEFNELLEEYWQTANTDDRLFYFPLYFWWNLTAILPLRPTEFLLTPRDCLNGKILTVRRTKLKGQSRTAYKIAEDYDYYKYEIADSLVNELRRYISLTENMMPTQIDTLLRIEPHFKRTGAPYAERNRYYNYYNMKTCIAMFYQEIVEPRGIKMNRVKLGDTRHLAMISLIISGGSPVVCRELAGHANIRISSHYYTNLSNLVECATIGRFRKSKGKSGKFEGNPLYPITRPVKMTRISEGFCDVANLKDGDVSECMKVIDQHGKIGECAGCKHYWPDVHGIRFEFGREESRKQRVDLDGAFLMRAIETVRKGIGYDEDITAALLRLQHSCYQYGDCLFQKYLSAEEAYSSGET